MQGDHITPARRILLSRGYFALVDDADFARVSAYKWCTFGKPPYLYGVSTAVGLMHRFILEPPSGMHVDHINGNGLDNRRANIRICTRGQNMANSRIQVNNVSGFRGVSWHKGKRKWRAKIQFQGRTIHLGYFSDSVAAARVYDRKARETFGEFARLNFP